MYSIDIISNIFDPWLFELINAEFMEMKRELYLVLVYFCIIRNILLRSPYSYVSVLKL